MGTIGILRLVGWRAHYEAIKESFVLALISTLPIVIAALTTWGRHYRSDPSWNAYATAVDHLLEHGELFMAALAYIAVIVWHVLKEWPDGLKPPRIVFGAFCFVAFALILVFYIFEANKLGIDVEVTLVGSKLLFGVTLIAYYLSTVLVRIEAPQYAQALSDRASELSQRLLHARKP